MWSLGRPPGKDAGGRSERIEYRVEFALVIG